MVDEGRSSGKRLSQRFLSNCKLKHIYNEFGLFYEWLSNKTYQHKSEKCSHGKLSKIRITSLAVGNTFGDNLSMFVIGKTKKPLWFKNVKCLPCRYINQRKDWMNGVLFKEWDRDIDKKFVSERRKVVLVTDNSSAYSPVENLNLVKLFSLPVKTTFQARTILKSQYHNNVIC